MQISSNFDGGNIEVVSAAKRTDLQVRIRPDNESEFFQWFYFRLSGARDQACTIHITNAGKVSYTKGFEDYKAVASYNRADWFRVPTSFDGKRLTIKHKPARDAVYYAYFAPYTMERHADLVAHCLMSPDVSGEVLGQTLDGQDLDLLRIGAPKRGRRVCWIIGRQHPGETMAEWWMEGLLERLTDPDDAVARQLLKHAVFYVVPNMNPDGSRRGHLRTNAAGVNLNREWNEPSMEKSPEVFLVRERMHKTGVDFCLDVHGDEGLPYNFVAGFEGIPSITDAQLALLEDYKATLARINPDFQTKRGYGKAPAGRANLAMCTNYVAEKFGCLAMTLEMPFKDATDTANPETGWSPARCRGLAWSCVDTLYALLDRLR